MTRSDYSLAYKRGTKLSVGSEGRHNDEPEVVMIAG